MARPAATGKNSTKSVVDKGRKIQAQVDSRDREKPASKPDKSPMQAGQRDYPDSFPPQHLAKPGLEADLKQKPLFEAPAYQGSEKLKDMVALITGADSGIGRAIAVLYAREGADIAIIYLDEHEDAETPRQRWKRKGAGAC